MTLTNGGSFNDKVNFICSVADHLLRGDFKQSCELTSSKEHREGGR